MDSANEKKLHIFGGNDLTFSGAFCVLKKGNYNKRHEKRTDYSDNK